MFRKVPPLEVLEQILRSWSFTGLDDKRWFSKDDLPLDSLEEWLPIVAPYYMPCKAERYLEGEMTKSRIITILRHLLRAHSIPLNSQERVVNGKKTTVYQIFSSSANSLVTFD
jgi:hypothetical protein